MAFKKARLGRHCNNPYLTPCSSPHTSVIYIQYIVRTEYKANNIRGIITGARVAEPHNFLPGEQAIPGLILDEATFLSVVDFQSFPVRLPMVGIQEAKLGRHSDTGALNPSSTHLVR